MKSVIIMKIILVAILITVVQSSCDEPKDCHKHPHRCAAHAKYRTKCPCTCAPHLNYINCCANQQFEQEICRSVCTYDTTKSGLFKKLYAICFNDYFKMQYCATNGYQNSTDCCLQNGVSKDVPGKKAGCSVFCEGNTPACGRLFEYASCTRGAQLENAVKCAISAFDKPRWKSNAHVHNCT